MFGIDVSGSFTETEKWLQKMSTVTNELSVLNKYGAMGVSALAAATPAESGLTASSWTYEIVVENGTYSIIWGNTNIENGVPIAVILQHGHGTGTGGYVAGRDFINPALRSIFDQAVAEGWKVVASR